LKVFTCKRKKEKRNKYKSNINVTKVNTLLNNEKTSIFRPKKIHGFYKNEKNERISNSIEKEINTSNDINNKKKKLSFSMKQRYLQRK
jgi:hypothetical protein